MATNQCQQNCKMSDKEIKVPNIGEFKDVEVIEVLVSNGQSVSKNDPLITIESDKSSVEIPSSLEGKIKSVNVKVGDKISEGDTILIFEYGRIMPGGYYSNAVFYQVLQCNEAFPGGLSSLPTSCTQG